MHKTYDYIIVGGGSAGCLLANRLSSRNKRTLLLEAGGNISDRLWVKIPIGYLYTMGNPQTDWCFVLRENSHLNGRRLNYPRGRGLGGSSAINGMIYMRGQAANYDLWAAQGCAGWSWREVLPFFIRHENNQSLKDEWHGNRGEVWVSELRNKWRILDIFAKSANACEIPMTPDFNNGDNFGVCYFQVNQKNGFRQTADHAFLKPARARPNLTVISRATARRLIIENNEAVGVEYQTIQGIQTARADGEIILAAGSIGSPQILQCSGIGDTEMLKKIGITAIHSLPGVGENLQDHLQIRSSFEIRGAPTLNEMSHNPLHKISMGLQYLLFRRGPLSSAPSQLGCFSYSDDSESTPDLQYHVQPLSLDSFGKPLHKKPGFTASVCHLRPRSRGYVRITSADPLMPPIIDARHLSDPYDQQIAARALRQVRKICATDPIRQYIVKEIAPGDNIQSDKALIKAAGDISTTIFHPVGTCKMGAASDKTAVVNPRLQVRGIDKLRIADASVMPDIISGNTNAPTLMIAEKAAAMIAEDNA